MKTCQQVHARLSDVSRQLLTPACQLCFSPQTSRLGLCSHCLDTLPWQAPGCLICQDQLSEFSDRFCPDCQHNPPDFTICRTALAYQAPIPGLIHQAKDLGNFPALYCLASILNTTFRWHYDSTDQRPEALIPVPSHIHRLGVRGYNQSLEICKILRRNSGIPILSNALVRNQGPSQKTLNRQQRLRNEGRMFTLKSTIKLTTISRIAIIDDVITTGSTVREIASLMRHQANIDRIDVWGVARSNSLHDE